MAHMNESCYKCLDYWVATMNTIVFFDRLPKLYKQGSFFGGGESEMEMPT